MRHTLLKTIMVIAALIPAASVFAQDIIVTTAAQKIEAKITEVTKSEIRYKEKDYLDGPTFVISTEEISSIIYASGKVVLYNQAEKTEPQPENSEKSKTAQSQDVVEKTFSLSPSPEEERAAEPAESVADENTADILLLSGQIITARIVELKSNHVVYMTGEEESTLPASQIERVTFQNGQVKAYNTQKPLIARKPQPAATATPAPRTSGRIYRDNNEYMYDNRYISAKEVARILETEDKAAYKQWKKGDGLVIGGAICAGIGGGLVIGGLASLSSGNPVPCIALECVALAPLGIGLGLCLGAQAQYKKAIDIYNSKYDQAAVQLKWRVMPDGVGLAIAF